MLHLFVASVKEPTHGESSILPCSFCHQAEFICRRNELSHCRALCCLFWAELAVIQSWRGRYGAGFAYKSPSHPFASAQSLVRFFYTHYQKLFFSRYVPVMLVLQTWVRVWRDRWRQKCILQCRRQDLCLLVLEKGRPFLKSFFADVSLLIWCQNVQINEWIYHHHSVCLERQVFIVHYQ